MRPLSYQLPITASTIRDSCLSLHTSEIDASRITPGARPLNSRNVAVVLDTRQQATALQVGQRHDLFRNLLGPHVVPLEFDTGVLTVGNQLEQFALVIGIPDAYATRENGNPFLMCILKNRPFDDACISSACV